MIKVGSDLVFYKKKQRRAQYINCIYDEDGWADASKFLPADYDLVSIRTDTKQMVGWSYGHKWDGLNLKHNDKVLYWKKDEFKVNMSNVMNEGNLWKNMKF